MYVLCCVVQLRLGIDDPLDSSAVHLVNGVLGMVLLAFVAKPSHVDLLTKSQCGGIFYTRLGWTQLGMQVLGESWWLKLCLCGLPVLSHLCPLLVRCVSLHAGLAVSLVVAAVLAALLFGILRHFNLLRVDQMTELAGIDNIEHGGPAYPEFNMTQLNGSELHVHR